MTASYSYLDWPGPIPMAHRGGASDVPENTMPAFEYAVGLDYRYVETDVQVTADGVLVAFHDDDLQRTCNRPGRISALPWSEVHTAMVEGEAPIPLLEDMLGTWPELRVNIDCKSDRAVEGLVSVLKRTNAVDRVCVGAFSDLRIRKLRAAIGPRLCTALAPAGVTALRFAAMRRSPAPTAQVPVKQGPLTVIDQKFVTRAHGLGIAVHAWTIDDAAEIARLLDLGVDGIITDRPTVLKDVLMQRGQWHGG